MQEALNFHPTTVMHFSSSPIGEDGDYSYMLNREKKGGPLKFKVIEKWGGRE